VLRLVQLRRGTARAVALVAEPDLRLLDGVESVWALVLSALDDGAPLRIVQRTIERPDRRQRLEMRLRRRMSAGPTASQRAAPPPPRSCSSPRRAAMTLAPASRPARTRPQG
jgi:hypothetical protein